MKKYIFLSIPFLIGVSSLLAFYFKDTAEIIRVIPMSSKSISLNKRVMQLAFGSCYVPQFDSNEIWDTISLRQPDLLVLLGDNVYQTEEKGEPELIELKQAYSQLSHDLKFSKLRKKTSLLATWDDHDYGLNDADGSFSAKKQSEQLFEFVWPIPMQIEDERLSRDGIYTSQLLGPYREKVQIILLDTRYFKSSGSLGESNMLGERQWNWLKGELKKEAQLRLIVSSIPVIEDTKIGENWHSHPRERTKLLSSITEANGGVSLILSGDSHYSYFSKIDFDGTSLLEITASSLNFPLPNDIRDDAYMANKYRVGGPVFVKNFGFIEIDWSQRKVKIKIIDDKNNVLMQEEVSLHDSVDKEKDVQNDISF